MDDSGCALYLVEGVHIGSFENSDIIIIIIIIIIIYVISLLWRVYKNKWCWLCIVTVDTTE
jgi:hypothetical protein